MRDIPHPPIQLELTPLYEKLASPEIIANFKVALQEIFSEYDDLVAAVSTDALGPERNLLNILKNKAYHTIAALGYIQSVFQYSGLDADMSIETIKAILLLELTQVDFLDSLAEHPGMRSTESQYQLFIGSKQIALTGEKADLFAYTKFPDPLHAIFKGWDRLINELGLDLYESLEHNPLWQEIRDLIDIRITNYYRFIGSAHTHNNEQDTAIFLRDIYRSTYDHEPDNLEQPPVWVTSPELWSMFFGESISFLLALHLTMTPTSGVDPATIRSMIEDVFRMFRTVGLLNVILDDIVDVAEDQKVKDPNLVTFLHNGKYAEDLMLMREQFGIQADDSLVVLIEAVVAQCYEDFMATKQNNPENRLVAEYMIIVPQMFQLYYQLARSKGLPDESLELLKTYAQITAQQYAELFPQKT